MIAFLADENFNNDVVHGIRRRRRDVDIARVQDVGLTSARDPEVLDRAATMGRLLLTHDASTVPPLAWDRVAAGLPMPGVFVVPRSVLTATAIEHLLLVAEDSDPEEWRGQVHYLPL